MLNKLKENKIFKTVYSILYTILFIVVAIVLLAVVLQRVSNNTISLGGFRIFNILTESMIPTYQVGDVLLAKTIQPNEIKVGDDVVYEGKQGSFAGKIVTHRVIEVKQQEEGKYHFITKGTANEIEDPEISEEQICGIIIYKIQTLSFVTKITNNLYGFYFVIFVPIVLIIFIKIVISIVNRKNDDDDSEAEEEKEESKEKDKDK